MPLKEEVSQMATSKDTGGQRQTTRRTEETEEEQATSTEEAQELHAMETANAAKS